MLQLDGTLSYWIIGILGTLLGLGLGSVLTYTITSRNRQNQNLQTELDQLAGRFTEYREQVGRHFMQTSDLVQEMTRSYRAVYEHLATGAYQLYGEHTNNQSLEHQQDEAKPVELDGITTDPDYDELAELSSLRNDIDSLLNESPKFRVVDVDSNEDKNKTVKH